MQPATHAVVPLSLHVKYWDYIGWKDPYADAAFGTRQRWLATLNRNRTVYTPGVFLDGVEWPDWSSAASQRERLLGGADVAPAADLAIAVEPGSVAGGYLLKVGAALRADGGASRSRVALFVALTESGLGNAVSAGENRGEQLRHDHVVRRWIGPVEPKNGAAAAAIEIDAARWTSDRFAISAFAQDLDSGEVLQAMRVPLAECRRQMPSG